MENVILKNTEILSTRLGLACLLNLILYYVSKYRPIIYNVKAVIIAISSIILFIWIILISIFIRKRYSLKPIFKTPHFYINILIPKILIQNDL